MSKDVKESDKAQILLLLLVEENNLIHRECARALSWITPAANVPKPVSEVKQINQSPPEDQNQRQNSYYSEPAPTIINDLESWLKARAATPTNWFMFNSSKYEEYLNSLEQDVRITSRDVFPKVPGTYKIEGLWRQRAGIGLKLYYPPNFNPENSSATIAVGISQRNTDVFYELPVENFIVSLNNLIRKVIE